MTATNPEQFRLSASAIAAFKACPTRFRLAYREGLRLAQDTDSQRVGTNWHAMHEVYANALSAGHDVAGAMDQVIAHLNERYADLPPTKTIDEWNLERQILITSFDGYLWYYEDDPVEYLSSELAFDLPLHAPRTGLPLPLKDVVRVGKIDHVIRWRGMVGSMERKSTSRSIAPDSDYWDRARKDTQVSMYALAFNDMQAHGLEKYGIVVSPDERFGNTLYDVWHKPTIKPKALTQKDTVAFIETGEYFGQVFEVYRRVNGNGYNEVMVDGEEVEVESGKKGFAIKETVGMFGARLLADIQERPDFYFARREIARTDAEIRRFRTELFNIYQAQRQFDANGCWYENEQQCRATFHCPYIPICYGPGADAVCDGSTTPPNFTRVFVDPTVNGNAIPEE